MAVVLLRLKLSIQRRAWGHGGAAQRSWFVAGWILALVLGVAGGGLVAAADAAGDARGDLGVLLLYSAVFLGWLLFPVLMPGMTDETVDPARLEQFPLSVRQQVSGLLLGGLVGPTALFTYLLAAGTALTAGEAVAARLGGLATALTFTVLCVATSRSVQALLAGALKSRRGRDFAIAAGGVIALGVYLLSNNAHRVTENLMGLANARLAEFLSWTPPGTLAQSALDAREGAWGAALVHLAVGVLWITLALGLWEWAIRRRVRGTSVQRRGPRAAPSREVGLDLIPAPLLAFRPTGATAAASQQVRYYLFRSPLAVQGILTSLVLAAVLGHTTAAEGDLAIGALFFAFALMSIGTVASNVFAFDDRGFAFLVATGAPLRPVLTGKVMASLVLCVPLLVAFVVVEAVLTSSWPEAFGAVLAGVGVLLIGAAVGGFVSVRAPQNHVRRNFNRGRALVATFGGMIAVALGSGVFALTWWLAGQIVDQTLALLVLVALTATLTRVAVRASGARLEADALAIQRLLGV